MQTPLILGSQSPRRAELLRHLLPTFEICSADIDEQTQAGEAPLDYVARMATEKNEVLQSRFQSTWILTADTVVVLEDCILQKPENKAQGIEMLQRLSNRSHWVHTAICLAKNHQYTQQVVSTQVWFSPVSAAQAQAYWATQEPWDKAGGYGIQGIGGQFVVRIEGSYSSVVGLPLVETRQLLETNLEA